MPAVDPAPVPDDLGVAVVSITTTRTLEEDDSGDRIVELIEEAGYEVPIRELINDDFDHVQRLISRLCNRKDVHVVLVNGGLGLHGRDVTEEAVTKMLVKTLPGVGEVLRHQLLGEAGTEAIVDRTFAGIREGVVICCFPAEVDVVDLAVSEIVLPEIEYLVGLAIVGMDDENAT